MMLREVLTADDRSTPGCWNFQRQRVIVGDMKLLNLQSMKYGGFFTE